MPSNPLFWLCLFQFNTLTKRTNTHTAGAHTFVHSIVIIDVCACVYIYILYVSQYGRFISCRTLNLLFIICCMNEWILPSLKRYLLHKTTWYLIDTHLIYTTNFLFLLLLFFWCTWMEIFLFNLKTKYHMLGSINGTVWRRWWWQYVGSKNLRQQK